MSRAQAQIAPDSGPCSRSQTSMTKCSPLSMSWYCSPGRPTASDGISGRWRALPVLTEAAVAVCSCSIGAHVVFSVLRSHMHSQHGRWRTRTKRQSTCALSVCIAHRLVVRRHTTLISVHVRASTAVNAPFYEHHCTAGILCIQSPCLRLCPTGLFQR